MAMALFFLAVSLAVEGAWGGGDERGTLFSASKLEMFVEKLPDMPRLRGYQVRDGVPVAGNLTIGMYEKMWKFHRNLPPTRVFAFGTSKETATVPGPTIEAFQGVPTHVTWTNHLPSRHILPWDPTLPSPRPHAGGVPTVVHLHGGVHPPHSDGNSLAWFTSSFSSTGPKWSRPTFFYPNAQPPGSLWYHDHAMALTRVNLLAGLFGAYSLLAPALESPLRLPSGRRFDLPLVVFDRSFLSDGSIYMNSTGNNPHIHPQWQPEYFGDAIIVNGKAWPFLAVRRRRYRFRIINASNARFFRFFFTNGLRFVHVASDSVYLPRPVSSKKFLLAPSEIADVIVDFSRSPTDSAILANDAPYPYPSGDPADEINGRVMKFVIGRRREEDSSRIPKRLFRYPAPAVHRVAKMRYVAMYEYESVTGKPNYLYLKRGVVHGAGNEDVEGKQHDEIERWDHVPRGGSCGGEDIECAAVRVTVREREAVEERLQDEAR